MKKLLILLIKGYRHVLSPILHQLLGVRFACRYSPTCSEYAIAVISKYGILYGSLLAIKRLVSCQPFHKHS